MSRARRRCWASVIRKRASPRARRCFAMSRRNRRRRRSSPRSSRGTSSQTIRRQRAVEKLAKSFTKSHGDLPTVYRTLVELGDSWAQPFAKYKTPTDYIVSSYRALELPVDMSRRGLASLRGAGPAHVEPGSPAGWPDRGADWDGASALMKRIEWADAVGQRVGARHERIGSRATAAGRNAERRDAQGDCPRGERRAGAHAAAHRP